MNVTEENRVRLDELNVEIVRGTIPLFGPTFSMRLHLQKILKYFLWFGKYCQNLQF